MTIRQQNHLFEVIDSLHLRGAGDVFAALLAPVGNEIDERDHRMLRFYISQKTQLLADLCFFIFAHGSSRIGRQTSSTKLISDAVMELYDRIVDPQLLIRRLNLAAGDVIDECKATTQDAAEQLDMVTDYEALERQRRAEDEQLARERQGQQAILEIKKKFGKNAILKGTSLMDGATAKDRNRQIGGHKA